MNTSVSAPGATELWFTMNSLVRDRAAESRARINERIDMPFSRFRALRRIAVQDLTQRDLARRMGIDAPAASVIVNDLAERGLVVRRPHASDGRAKVVTITEAGRRAVAALTEDPSVAPPMFGVLDATDRATLGRLLERLRVAADS